MKYFLVGGAVRDELLGYPTKDRDWVVVGASPQTMLDQGFTQVGKDFPVFLHPHTQEEYALARTERKIGSGYTGFAFDTSHSVSLEDDLARRDLTINAIARDEAGNYIDPFDGQKDIETKTLRHVTDAFCEDPVRVLRVARFAARYHHLGFEIAKETLALMTEMVENGEIQHLVPERVWQEFYKALTERSPNIFIETLRRCGGLAVIMPELNNLFGVPQPEKHHPEIDTGIHSLMCLKTATELSDSPRVRFAALIHDLGKALTPEHKWPSHHGHEKSGLKPIRALCERLKVPNEFRDLALITSEFHTHVHRAMELQPKTLLKLFETTDAFRRQERFAEFLLACEADARGRTGFEKREYPQRNYVAKALSATRFVDAKRFVEQGFKGKDIGEAIRKERLRVLKTLNGEDAF